jgi:hypothetical protein
MGLGAWPRQRIGWVRYSASAAVTALICGCLSGCLKVNDADGTTHHVILGFGVVSVKQAPDNAMTVTNSNVLGLHVTDQSGTKVGLGYSSTLTTTVSDGAEDVRAEIQRRPFGRLNIIVDKADLRRPVLAAGNAQANGEPKAETLELPVLP